MPGKSESKKVKKKEPATKTVTPKDQPNHAEGESKNPFDFGGLPSRDIKKNLGCG